jgi:hypothetical protein
MTNDDFNLKCELIYALFKVVLISYFIYLLYTSNSVHC